MEDFSFCFFFSSRRRHTRCLSDWSSDVCSSDLSGTICQFKKLWAGSAWKAVPQRRWWTCWADTWARSEERRVGKECRSAGWPEHGRRRGKVGRTEPAESQRQDERGSSRRRCGGG